MAGATVVFRSKSDAPSSSLADNRFRPSSSVRRCYPRSAQTGKLKRSHCVNVRRAAALVAVRVGYGRGHRPPILGKPRRASHLLRRQVVGSQT